MRKKFLLLLYFLYSVSSSTFAQSADMGILYTIDDINTGKTKFKPSAVQCLLEPQIKQFEVKAEDQKYRQTCAIALCGAPWGQPSVYVDKQNLNSITISYVKTHMDKMKPKLKAALEAIREQKKVALQDAEKKLFSGDTFNFNPKSWENTDAFTEINTRAFEKYLKIQINKSAPVGKKISYQVVDDGTMDPGSIQGIREYKENLEAFKNSNPETLLGLDLLSKDEAKLFVKNQINSFEVIINKNSKSSGQNSANLERAKKSIKKLKSHLTLPVSDVRDYLLEAAIDLYETENVVSEVDPLFIGGSFQKACVSSACMSVYQNYFQSIKGKEIFDTYKKELDNPEQLERSITRCLANMIATEEKMSADFKAEELYRQVVPTMLNTVVAKFSEHTKKHFTNYFKNDLAVSAKSLTPKNATASILPLEQFDQMITDAANNPTTFQYDEATTLRELIRHADGEIPNPLATSSFCNSDSISIAWDAYMNVNRAEKIKKMYNTSTIHIPSKDTIHISPFTCNHTEPGKSIIAHELGHAISDGFLNGNASSKSAQTYLKLRNCVSKNHANSDSLLESSEFSFDGDYVKTEEDTADLLAFMAYKDSPVLFSCSLLKQSNGNKKFIDLFVAEDTESSHSPAFYRLMMESINKGVRLPPSCQIVIEKSKSLIGFQKCID